tara:strand:+ start:188 stop:424 length:237 start_codon:yes stop_codon:yes gene_type:complete
MAKPIKKLTWRETRDAALRKKHNERKARAEKTLYCYLKREIEKTWKDYAIIAGGVFLGILLFILWITYADWSFGSTYK